jgi:sugar lactone lactonase YvrE
MILTSKKFVLAAITLLVAATLVQAQASSAVKRKLTAAYRLHNIVTGVTTTADGRVFALFSHLNEGPDTHIVELAKDGGSKLYPDVAWNSWKPGDDPARAFVAVNALRMGPDGLLWIVDTGTRGFGTPVIDGGAKLVAIDVQKNSVRRVYPLQTAATAMSYVDDIRFHGSNAYLTDAGVPGIIVLDLHTGKARRVLDHDPSTTAHRPLRVSGAVLLNEGKEIYIHADQLEVSPDGKWFYYQPACGPMYRIETRYLDTPGLSAEEVSRHAQLWAETPSTGGTVIDADGNIYLSDLNTWTIYKLTPDGKKTVLLHDERLDWVDAMWIDRHGNLWMPAAQLDRMAVFQKGVSRVKYPVVIYTIPIGHQPQY